MVSIIFLCIYGLLHWLHIRIRCMNDRYYQNPDTPFNPENPADASLSGLLGERQRSENPAGAPRTGLLADYRQNQPNSSPPSQPGQFKQQSPVGGRFMGPGFGAGMPPGYSLLPPVPPQSMPMGQPPVPSYPPAQPSYPPAAQPPAQPSY